MPLDEPSFQKTLAEPTDLMDWDDRPDSFPDRPRVWGIRTDPEQGSWERNAEISNEWSVKTSS